MACGTGAPSSDSVATETVETTESAAEATHSPSPAAVDGGSLGPTRVAVNPTTNRIYVTNQLGGSVSVIDATTNQPLAKVPVARRRSA